MISILIDCIYYFCFRVKKKTKFEDIFDNIEDLTEEEFSKLMRYYKRLLVKICFNVDLV